ncbi:adhesion G-protein coupled receptor G7-like [Apostichopus japonicus]|uniref:adhesion G-protein coupled receptor G7-like n=1 Tax=Stichopus japonicus TaxID=307972 RepID=UPI003AB87AC5
MYECPEGWKFNGNDSAVCLYGEWTSEDAFCQALPCAEPHPPDELVSHIPDLPDGELYPNGTEIMYECPKGWDSNGNNSAVCLYGEWTSEDAFCEALPCAEPHPPDELVSHIPDLPDGELYPNGTEIMYECPDGWNLNGNTKAVCLYGMWTNENAVCSEILPTMCPFQSLSFSGVQLTFRATDPGSRVNSIQNCSEESSNAYQPLAMRFCDEDGWEEPVLTSCYTPEDAADVVERIANTTVTEENVDEVASDLALVTTQTEDLDVSEVEDVAESLRDIANVNSSSPEVTESVVGTVNNLMEVNERSLEQTVGSSSVIVSLEQQISNVQKNPNNFTDVQHNVGVQAVKLDPDITKAVTFINLPPSNTTGRDAVNADLAEENTRLFNDKQEVRTDNSTTSIYVPSMILELALEVDPTITHVPISFFIYKDSRLFQTSQASSTSAPEKDRSKNRQEIASQVIAATLEVANVVIKDLPPENSIVTRFTIAPPLGQNEVVKEEKCVFWSVSEEGNGGTWSAEGCALTKDKNQTVCTCNHLTSFAVLVGIGSDLPEALSIITVVGSSLSISGLILCISSLSLIGGLRTKQASQIHLNLCLCLLAFYVVFLVGDFVIDKPRHCNNIATTIHYLCLTTVAWMSVEALHMYLLFVKFKTPKLFQLKLRYFVPVSAVSVYGLCLIPVLSVLFLSSQEVDGYCFLPSGQGLLFGLILEVLVMVLFNLVVFSLLLRNIVFRPIMPSNAKRYKKKEMFSRLQQFVVFWFLLGMSWIFGFFAMIPNRESVVFEYLFCLFTSLQGFFLFIFICLKNPEVVNRFKKTREYLSEWSNEKNKSSLKTLRTGESNSTQRAAQSSEL